MDKIRICYINRHAPGREGPGMDPRRRELYGSNMIWIAPSIEAGKMAPYANPIFLGEIYRERLSYVSPLLLRTMYSTRSLQPLLQYLKNIDADVVPIVGSYSVAIALAKLGQPFVFDPTDSRALFYWRRYKEAPIGFRQKLNSLRLYYNYRALEQLIGSSAQLTIITGPSDKSFLEQLCPSSKIFQIPNGTHFVQKHPVVDQSDGATIGFHGTMVWEPNRLTALRLASFVAPQLARNGSSITVSVAGDPVPEALKRYIGCNGFRAEGFVSDLRGWMARLTLYVMPMYGGAGIKNKLIEALALGLPVVTNKRGAEMLGEDAQSVVEVAADDSDLINRILRLLDDRPRRNAMRLAARAYAEAHFDWMQARRALERVIYQYYICRCTS